MADPLSITASCLALLSAVIKTSTTVTEFIRGCRESRRELTIVSRELSDLRIVLELLKDDTDGNLGHVLPDVVQKQILSIIADCTNVTTDIDDILERHKGKRGAMKWAIDGKREIAGKKNTLEAHRGALSLALETVTLMIAKDIKKDTGDILVETSAIKGDTSQILAEIRKQRAILLVQQENPGRAYLLEKYFDNLATVAESVCSDHIWQDDASTSSSEGYQNSTTIPQSAAVAGEDFTSVGVGLDTAGESITTSATVEPKSPEGFVTGNVVSHCIIPKKPETSCGGTEADNDEFTEAGGDNLGDISLAIHNIDMSWLTRQYPLRYPKQVTVEPSAQTSPTVDKMPTVGSKTGMDDPTESLLPPNSQSPQAGATSRSSREGIDTERKSSQISSVQQTAQQNAAAHEEPETTGRETDPQQEDAAVDAPSTSAGYEKYCVGIIGGEYLAGAWGAVFSKTNNIVAYGDVSGNMILLQKQITGQKIHGISLNDLFEGLYPYAYVKHDKSIHFLTTDGSAVVVYYQGIATVHDPLRKTKGVLHSHQNSSFPPKSMISFAVSGTEGLVALPSGQTMLVFNVRLKLRGLIKRDMTTLVNPVSRPVRDSNVQYCFSKSGRCLIGVYSDGHAHVWRREVGEKLPESRPVVLKLESKFGFGILLARKIWLHSVASDDTVIALVWSRWQIDWRSASANQQPDVVLSKWDIKSGVSASHHMLGREHVRFSDDRISGRWSAYPEYRLSPDCKFLEVGCSESGAEILEVETLLKIGITNKVRELLPSERDAGYVTSTIEGDIWRVVST